MKRLLKKLFPDRKRRQITIASSMIVVFSTITLYIMFSELGIHWPTEEQIAGQETQLKQLRRKLRKSLERGNILSNKEQSLERMSKYFWVEHKNSHIDTEMRVKIESCAKRAGFKLESMGNIRKSSLTKGLNKLEISISAKSPIDKVVHFLNNIRSAKPTFFWQNCNIRPDNMINPSYLYFTGTLTVITINKATIKQLLN